MTPNYTPGEKVIYRDRIHTVLGQSQSGWDLRSIGGTPKLDISAMLIAPLVKDEEMKAYKELRAKMGDYTEAELVSFGNFMLNQDKRKRKEQVRASVTHADRMNWEHSRKV